MTSLVSLPMPTFLQMEPVGQCNLRCRMCPIQYRKDGPPHGPPAFMDFDLFLRILDQFPGLQRLQLQGLGEPMMHPRFFDMVTTAVRRGIEVSTNTNLTLLNDLRAERCVTSGLAKLHASLDGATAETFEFIRVRAHFDRVLANLQRLLDARKRFGSETPRVRIVCVAMRKNLHELPELVRLAHRLGVSTIFVQHLCHDFTEEHLPESYRPMRTFVDEQSLVQEDPLRIDRFFTDAAAEANRLGVDLRLPSATPMVHPPEKPGRERCDWPWTGAYLSYQGLGMPCCMVSTPDRIQLGDYRLDSAENIWHGPAYTRFREALGSETPPDVCASCSVYRGIF
jgi:MoaA/NifB/PqqE/SkfB family radical SAM enzyme